MLERIPRRLSFLTGLQQPVIGLKHWSDDIGHLRAWLSGDRRGGGRFGYSLPVGWLSLPYMNFHTRLVQKEFAPVV